MNRNNNCCDSECVVLSTLENIMESYQGEKQMFVLPITEEDEGCSHRETNNAREV